jgi:hypothetical protein
MPQRAEHTVYQILQLRWAAYCSINHSHRGQYVRVDCPIRHHIPPRPASLGGFFPAVSERPASPDDPKPRSNLDNSYAKENTQQYDRSFVLQESMRTKQTTVCRTCRAHKLGVCNPISRVNKPASNYLSSATESARLVRNACFSDDRARDIKSTRSSFLIGRHHRSESQERPPGCLLHREKQRRRAPLHGLRPGVMVLQQCVFRKLGDALHPALSIRQRLASSQRSS